MEGPLVFNSITPVRNAVLAGLSSAYLLRRYNALIGLLQSLPETPWLHHESSESLVGFDLIRRHVYSKCG